MSGNQVKIGTFEQNTAIGFVLMANGWSNGQVTSGYGMYYTDPSLNPESDPSLRQHSVLLTDPARDIYLLGFEDLDREGWTDDDFNDAMFFVSANPIVAVDATDIELVDYTGNDQDGDGVADNLDEYPDDPAKAFNNYYPDESNFGSLAFEDLWPARGDYDFNDLVVDYNFNQITNGDNDCVEISARIVVRAVGAGFKNGFGIQFPVQESKISDVQGIRLFENYIQTNSKNLEAGHTDEAVVIVFDNANKVLEYPGGGEPGINVTPGAPYVTPDTIDLIITLSEPASLSDIGAPPFNPFIIINMDRGREVHLPDREPTSLINSNYFGQDQDDSDPAAGRYFRTENHLPWAINIIDEFAYPVEKSPIINGHLKFATWAESGGTTVSDWYQDKTGYRNETHIYDEP